MRSQAGNYTCETQPPNPDNSTSATATVVVQFAPDVTADAVCLVDVPVGIGTLMISCSYLGIPPPHSVTWIRDDITLDPDADSRVTVVFDDTRTTLTITEVMENEGGTHRCVPTNVVGSNSATTQVRIQLPPGRPTSLAVVPDSETVNSFTISWTNPDFNGFSPIAGFTVNLTSRQPDDIIRSIPGDATTMMATLNSLPPFTEYTIQLSVRNAVELEGEPAVIIGMTNSFNLDQVMNLMATAVISTAIMVTWMAPTINTDTTAPVNNYQVTYGIPGGGGISFLTTPANNSVTLNDLRMGTEYTISVLGINIAGDGPSTSVTESTFIDPAESTGANLSTGATVAITFIITLLVSLQVGVVIGMILSSQTVRKCAGRVWNLRKSRGREDGDIYEQPDNMAAVIQLSENKAYARSGQRL